MFNTPRLKIGFYPNGHRRYAVEHGLTFQQVFEEGAENMFKTIEFIRGLSRVSDIAVFMFDKNHLLKRPPEQVQPMIAAGDALVRKIHAELSGVSMSFVGDSLVPEVNGYRAFTSSQREKLHVHFLTCYDVAWDLDYGPFPIRSRGIPSLDLAIFTGGGRRLGEFLPYQIRNAAIYHEGVMWPDFTHGHLTAILDDYATLLPVQLGD